MEPEIKNIDSDGKIDKALADHSIVQRAPLPKFNSHSESIVPSEYRQCGSQSESSCIDRSAIYQIILLSVVSSGTICHFLHIVSDVISVWNVFNSDSE